MNQLESFLDADLLKKYETIREVLDSRGTNFDYIGYQKFWDDLANIRYSTFYLICLMMEYYSKHLPMSLPVSLLLGKLYQGTELPRLNMGGPMEVSKEFSQDERIELSALLHTIYFVALYYRFEDSAPAFQQMVSTFSTCGPANAIDSILIEELSRMMTADHISTNAFILSLVDKCSSVDKHLENLYTRMVNRSIPEKDSFDMTQSLIFPHLVRAVENDKLQKRQILDTIQIFLKHPGLSSNRLNALIFMLRHVGTFSTLTSEDFKKCLEIIIPFYLWPCPFGETAKEMLDFLNKESKLPGSALCTLLNGEYPELCDTNLVSKDKYGERTVHVLLNVQSKHGRKFQALMSSELDEIPTNDIRIGLLKIILRQTGDVDNLCLESFPEADLVEFYKDGLRAIEEIDSIWDDDEQIELRDKLLNLLREKIVTKAETMGLKVKPTVAFYPSLLPMKIEIRPITKISLPGTAVSPENGFPIVPAYDILKQIVEFHKANAVSGSQLKISIGGGDGTLHQVVMAYVSMAYNNHVLLESVDIAFHLLPLGENNNLSRLISMCDSWYYDHVFRMIQSSMLLLPSIGIVSKRATSKVSVAVRRPTVWQGGDDVEDLDFEDSLMTVAEQEAEMTEQILPPSPCTILREELQHYFRNSESTFKLNVYLVETWAVADNKGIKDRYPEGTLLGKDSSDDDGQKKKKAQKGPCYYRAFPSIETVEFGSTIEQEMGSKAGSAPVAAKILQTDVVGRRRASPTNFPLTLYERITISNIPQSEYEDMFPNPSQPWLEMQFALPEEVGKKKKKVPQLKFDPVYYVSVIELESTLKKSFHLKIDGKLCGPFYKMKMAHLRLPMSEHTLVFPIKTIIPIDFS